MRLSVQHQTVYRYEKPIPYSIQTLRVSPRPYDGCAVRNWSVRGEGRREVPSLIDGFGNLTHSHAVTRPHTEMTLSVEVEVETTDTAGVVRGAPEPLPPLFFLRETALTAPHPAIAALAAQVGGAPAVLARLHSLMSVVRDAMDYQLGVTDVQTAAADALQT